MNKQTFLRTRAQQNTNVEMYKLMSAADILYRNDLSHDDIVSNHQPISIAAGIILLISKIYNLDINKKKISSTLDISEVTINKIYNKINNQQIKDIIIKNT